MNKNFSFILKAFSLILGAILLINLISLRYNTKLNITKLPYKTIKIIYTPQEILKIVLPNENFKF